MNEFSLIEHFFAERNKKYRADVILGIGDDCAIVEVPPGQQLLLSMDTLISGVHFPENTSPYDIGYKALAVNLSDLAAMGASPAWFSLALTLPSADEAWLATFSAGLFDLAQEFNVSLIGGDTTKGTLSITIQIGGFAPKNKAIKRSGAKPGDGIYVTNYLGDAGLALQHLQEKIQLVPEVFSSIKNSLNRPFPRVREGLLFCNYASAMIDLSDGLISDLGHILKRSRVGAVIHTEKLPLSNSLSQALPFLEAIKLALTAGDDYELCCTIPADQQQEFEEMLQKEHVVAQRIGCITDTGIIELLSGDEQIDTSLLDGYSHF